jgi:hypothetical protein
VAKWKFLHAELREEIKYSVAALAQNDHGLKLPGLDANQKITSNPALARGGGALPGGRNLGLV